MVSRGSSEAYFTVSRERVVIVRRNFKEGALVCEQRIVSWSVNR